MRGCLGKQEIVLVVTSVLCLVYFHLPTLPASAEAPRVGLTNSITASNNGYGSPVRLANLENQSVKESSGIAASRRHTEILWTHNDSGDGAFIYAFDRQGRHRGVWRVSGAEAEDWEDMAIGPGPMPGRSYIYVGDIGDNSKKRDQITVYRVAEPPIAPGDKTSTNENPKTTEIAEAIRLKYPDGKHDAETLLVHPVTADIYIVTKAISAAARVYKLQAPWRSSGVVTLRYLGEFRFPNLFQGFITGGDISPDGRRVILCDYLGACELVLPDRRGVAFDQIWKQSPLAIVIGDYRGGRREGEAICFRPDGRALLATSEGLPCPLIEIARRN